MAEEHTIRPMRSDDVDPAAEVMINGGWGDRRRFLRFCVDEARFVPLVAEVDDRIVGTGVATVSGRVGWVGMIFVDEGLRGRGIGTTLTQAVIDELEGAGCTSLALLASPFGKPIYERLGFRAEVGYRLIAAPGPGPAATEAEPGRLRSLRPDDLPVILAIDAEATGEDRSYVIRASADPTSGSSPWDPMAGSWATSCGHRGAPTRSSHRRPVDGVRLLEDRRTRTAAGAEARTAIPESNRAGLTALENLGWRSERSLVRMVRGAPIAWHPSAIWGQFNFALG